MRKLFALILLCLVLVALVPAQDIMVVRKRASGAGASSLLTGLVAYWKMEAATGASQPDSIGSHTLAQHVAAGNITSVTGKIDQGSQFAAGSAQYYDTADHADFDATSAFTFACWFQTSGAANQVFMSKWDYGTAAGYTVSVTGAGDEIRVWIADGPGDGGSNIVDTTDADLVAATWYHLVVTYDGAATPKVKVYIDATLKTPSVTGTIPATLQTNSVAFNIANWPGLGRNWDGKMDELGFWKNAALNSTQITCLYDSGSPDSNQQPPFAGCP